MASELRFRVYTLPPTVCPQRDSIGTPSKMIPNNLLSPAIPTLVPLPLRAHQRWCCCAHPVRFF